MDGVLDQGPKVCWLGKDFAQEAGYMSSLLGTALDRRVGGRLDEVLVNEPIASGHCADEDGHDAAEFGPLKGRHGVGVAKGFTNLRQHADPYIIVVVLDVRCCFGPGIVFIGDKKSNILSPVSSCCCEGIGFCVQVAEKYIVDLAML